MAPRPTQPLPPPPPPPPPARTFWQLRLDDGQLVDLDQPVIIGRSPAVDAHERAVALADDTRSVSKTHLRIEADADEIWVTDLHSTNGVAIVTDATVTACAPGIRVPVPHGASVRFGDRNLQLLPPVG